MDWKIIAGIIGSIALVVGGAWLASRPQTTALPPEAGTILSLNADDHQVQNGAPSASLVEYSDFQCPACAAFAPAVKQIVQEVPGVSFAYRHFPLTTIHRNALPAAEAAEAAHLQGKFWEYHDMLFAKQQAWSALSSAEAEAFFVREAEALGLDAVAFSAALTSKAVQDRVARDQRDGRTLGITSTPTFFLNGERIQPRTLEEFRAQIEAAVQRTQE